MGRKWLPKTLALWTEPRRFTRWHVAEELKAWSTSSRLAAVAAMFGIALLPLLVGPNGLRPPPLEETLWMLLFAILMPWAVVWLLLHTPRTIRITEYGLAVTSSQTAVTSFEEIARVIPRTREIDGRRFCVLSIERITRPSLELAVDDTISMARIKEILRAQGVRFGD